MFFVGDLFTKGPDPKGVWRLVRDHHAVLGNHDDRLLKVLAGKRANDTHARQVVAHLDHEDRAWREWLAALPLYRQVDGWGLVHACVAPSGRPEDTDRDSLLVRRCRDGESLRWWRSYSGPRRVVFGHDAMRGVVRVERDGQPVVIGLDSGCVYGGFLSGYVLETDELIQVRARAVYKPI